MAFLPQYFLSNINSKDGLASPSKFEVIVPIPQYINNYIGNSFLESIVNLPNNVLADVSNVLNYGDSQRGSYNPEMSRYLALQCEQAELPGRSLITEDVKIYGPTYKVPYQTQYQETSLTFICTNEFYERKLFDRWMSAIMPPDTNNLRYALGSNTRYLTDIKITQYNQFIKQIYSVELIDAFPIAVASQPLNWGATDFHRVTVQFAYQKFEVDYDGQYDIVQAAIEIFGQGAARWFDGVNRDVAETIGDVFRIIT